MDVIRAPWRMEYINDSSGHKDKNQGCIFCAYPKEDRDAENLIVARGDCAFVMMNRYPYSSGHLMVIPYRHTSDYASLTAEESLEIAKLSQHATQTLQAEMSSDGFNIGMNIGKVAGAGIDTHLHLHVVPRWNGDTNFMSVTAETKVLPEALSATWERLVKAWNNKKA